MEAVQNKPGMDRRALYFILFTAFLNLAGIGLIGPVSSFLVGRYVENPDALAAATGLLFTAYSICQFLAVPGLGALSDRYGRKPVLVVCLVGSAIGYLLLGVGGALWVLFLGRIIDGITGGNLGAIYAYIADITEPKDRTRYYGLLGAVSGLGFVIGPAVGGILAKIGGATAPAYFAAVVTLVNALWGWWAMPESLPKEKRTDHIKLAKLNPLSQLISVFALPQLRWLLVATLFVQLPFAMMQSNLSVLGQNVLKWTPDQVAGVFTVVGVVGIIVQGGLIRPLLKAFGELRLAVAGIVIMAVGFLLLSQVPTLLADWAIYGGAAIFALGNGMLTPSLTGLTSQAVGPREQGKVQGGSQSVQALGRILGPAYGSAAYVSIGAGSPYWIGSLLFGIGAACVLAAIPSIRAAQAGKSANIPVNAGG